MIDVGGWEEGVKRGEKEVCVCSGGAGKGATRTRSKGEGRAQQRWTDERRVGDLKCGQRHMRLACSTSNLYWLLLMFVWHLPAFTTEKSRETMVRFGWYARARVDLRLFCKLEASTRAVSLVFNMFNIFAKERKFKEILSIRWNNTEKEYNHLEYNCT